MGTRHVVPRCKGSLADMRTRIEMYFLGGTISMSSASGSGVRPTLTGEELVASIPGVDTLGVDLSASTIAREQSGSLTFDHLFQVLEAANTSSADGFVLVQGTDTLEEAAYFLDLLWASDKPFVVTGAMRNPSQAGADGSANLISAILAASSPETRGLGVMVAFADELHAARYVTKSDTTSLTTFTSPSAGPIGRVLEQHVHVLMRPRRFPPLICPEAITKEFPIVHVGLGQSEKSLRALAEVSDGIIIAGLGAGHVPSWWTPVIDEFIFNKSFIMTSRAHSGPALTMTYGAVGAEVDLQKRGVVTAGYLSAEKARLIMLVVMSLHGDREEAEGAIAARGEFRFALPR